MDKWIPLCTGLLIFFGAVINQGPVFVRHLRESKRGPLYFQLAMLLMQAAGGIGIIAGAFGKLSAAATLAFAAIYLMSALAAVATERGPVTRRTLMELGIPSICGVLVIVLSFQMETSNRISQLRTAAIDNTEKLEELVGILSEDQRREAKKLGIDVGEGETPTASAE